MFRIRWFLAAASLALVACSPTLNWREVRVGDADLKAMLPCKPDRASRRMAMAGHEVDMQMVGCEAGGALFAVSVVDLVDAGRVAQLQPQWQQAMLQAMKADPGASTGVYSLKGADASPTPVRLSARGQRPDGSAVQAQAVWFARGTRLFHAAVYAERLNADMVDPFFSGFEFQ
jgi:hypothetical protein